MRQCDFVIRNKTGLHARPAKVFVNTAKQFVSDIRVRHGAKQVNAKSMISVLTLGVERGKTISVEIEGVDEDQAMQALEKVVSEGLGEEVVHDMPTPAAPSATAVPGMATEGDSAGGVLRGIGAVAGIAIGPIHRVQHTTIAIEERAGSVAHEQARLRAALDEARNDLVALSEDMTQRATGAEADIFAVHQELLEDADLLEPVQALLQQGVSAAMAWQQVTQERAAQLAGLSDTLLAERANDVRDVGARVLRILTGAPDAAPDRPDEPVILVAHELTPSETAALDPTRVLGFCTATGGPNSHAAILARALGIPAVVSAGTAVLDLAEGTMVILDGTRGTLLPTPDDAAIAAARAQQETLRTARATAQAASSQPAITQDGHRVEVGANIGGLEAALKAAESGAEGIGLLRTEFLFLDRAAAPTEEEQFEVYRSIVQAMGGQPVIVRTLDIGGDKPLPYLDLPHEDNPFLGERGIRLSLARPEIMRQQLRAVLRAASYGPVRIMFPMVADVREWRVARAMVEEIRVEVGAPEVKLGIMVEIPSVAMMADVLAREVDFFSIGTNDLTQYTLAADRLHPKLAAFADGLHPAVLRLIDRTVQAAHAAGKWVGICGELGSDPQAVPILIGLGVDELSVAVPAIPAVKAQIRASTLRETRACAERALACATAEEVRKGQNHDQ
jgi:phosphoenolpyruvate-protein phosphotransferase